MLLIYVTSAAFDTEIRAQSKRTEASYVRHILDRQLFHTDIITLDHGISISLRVHIILDLVTETLLGEGAEHVFLVYLAQPNRWEQLAEEDVHGRAEGKPERPRQVVYPCPALRHADRGLGHGVDESS